MEEIPEFINAQCEYHLSSLSVVLGQWILSFKGLTKLGVRGISKVAPFVFVFGWCFSLFFLMLMHLRRVIFSAVLDSRNRFHAVRVD